LSALSLDRASVSGPEDLGRIGERLVDAAAPARAGVNSTLDVVATGYLVDAQGRALKRELTDPVSAMRADSIRSLMSFKTIVFDAHVTGG
jgi:hypothetical protein